MKKHFVITLMLAVPFLCGATVTECTLPTYKVTGAATPTTCTSNISAPDAHTWTTTCKTGTKSVTVRGVALCLNKEGKYSAGATHSYCWCRAVSPQAGDWYLVEDLGDEAGCMLDCAYNCPYGL